VADIAVIATDWNGTTGAADEPDVETLRIAANAAFAPKNTLLGGLTVNCVDDDNAASTGTALMVGVNELGFGFFASAMAGGATTAALTDTGGDMFRVQYHADPATAYGAVQVYFDENGAAEGRFLAISPFNNDILVPTLDGRLLVVADDDSAASNGVAVYIDDDAADATEKLMFVSPTDTTGTDTLSTSKSFIVSI
jgi:hypothetical protein